MPHPVYSAGRPSRGSGTSVPRILVHLIITVIKLLLDYSK